MASRNLTDALVRGLTVGPKERIAIHDAKAPGLCIRVSSGFGRINRSWSFVYRPKGTAKLKRLTIGDFPAIGLADAREAAFALRRKVQLGGDPVGERKSRKAALTVAGLVDLFMEQHARKRLRSADDYLGAFKRDLIPSLGEKLAADVETTDVGQMLNTVAARAPVSANRLQNMTSSLFAWGVSEGLIERNPVGGLRKRTEEKAKDRVLDDDEIKRFWSASETMAPAFRDAFRLILLTGQRPGECAGIRRDEVDLRAGIWTLPAERTKNKLEHAVPLVGRALEIMTRLMAGAGKGPLIVTPRGKELTAQNQAKAFERLRAAAHIDGATPHDLRRSAATRLAALGVDRMTVALVLNHSSTTKATVTGAVYDKHDYLAQKRHALEALNAEILRCCGAATTPSAVVPLVRRRRP